MQKSKTTRPPWQTQAHMELHMSLKSLSLSLKSLSLSLKSLSFSATICHMWRCDVWQHYFYLYVTMHAIQQQLNVHFWRLCWGRPTQDIAVERWHCAITETVLQLCNQLSAHTAVMSQLYSTTLSNTRMHACFVLNGNVTGWYQNHHSVASWHESHTHPIHTEALFDLP